MLSYLDLIIWLVSFPLVLLLPTPAGPSLAESLHNEHDRDVLIITIGVCLVFGPLLLLFFLFLHITKASPG